ncbi:pyruvate kinase [Paenibacillus polymyxa]|uniref:pyruvate kinase n=1 Tax=Paenibacillus polymyxa TaxID=1406 RepID=UPI0020365404|nr:pyruvate kinase [Paenibacillus polymyxa]
MSLNIPNSFSLDDIHRRLTDVYFAEKVDLSFFSDLISDPHAGFDQAIAAYVFKDKKAIRELTKLNREDEIDESMEYGWIVNSTQIGNSNLLTLEICIFHGIEKEDINIENMRFKEYLIMLYLTGYIHFENDILLPQLINLYRNGHYLRHFGPNNGSGIYLYE